MIIDVIVLSKDNPRELLYTLSSCIAQFIPAQYSLVITVIDSSINQLEVQSIVNDFILSFCDAEIILKRLYPPSGIYPAMNYAIENSNSDCLLFMNSGDTFYDDQSLFHLVNQYDISYSHNSEFRGCFGITHFSAYSSRLNWTTPPFDHRLLNRWLLIYYPCHQSILFNTCWAKSNLYDINYSIDADATVIRELTRDPHLFSYISHIVCSFSLGGRSSGPMKLGAIFKLLKSRGDRHLFSRYLLRYFLSPSFLPFSLLPFWSYLRYVFACKFFLILGLINGK